MTLYPILVRQHWPQVVQGPSVSMFAFSGVRMAANLSLTLSFWFHGPFKARISIPAAAWASSLTVFGKKRYWFTYWITYNTICITLIENRSFAVQLNCDDITREKISETIFFLTTLIFFAAFVFNRYVQLSIFHYFASWFACPATSIIPKFEANVSIKNR